MIVETYPNAAEFLLKTQAFLEADEAANNLLLGICFQLKNFPDRIKTTPYFAAVTAGQEMVLAALMTPPHRVVIYGRHNHAQAVDLLACQMQAAGLTPPGVVGPASVALALARSWSNVRGVPYRAGMRQRIYELRQVSSAPPVAGQLRLATAAEIDLITQWALSFQTEALTPGHPGQTRETIAWRVEQREIYLWENGQPVSAAARGRPISNGISVNFVYTPPEFRRRGYATAVVAALSQILLDVGWKFCTLFTDLANPTSNHIYQTIGYTPVCDFNEYVFDV